MSVNAQKALHHLRMGIYTPIVFGLLFLAQNPLLGMVDPTGKLAQKADHLFGLSPSAAVGGALLFWGFNTLIYFRRYTKTLDAADAPRA